MNVSLDVFLNLEFFFVKNNSKSLKYINHDRNYF